MLLKMGFEVIVVYQDFNIKKNGMLARKFRIAQTIMPSAEKVNSMCFVNLCSLSTGNIQIDTLKHNEPLT